MSLWSPTHVQFTVLRARNLLAKGKGGNNDVFVTIQLGKEKYQTSTIKSALNPEWFEECDIPIPSGRSEIQVHLYHRGVLSDDFLGYAAIRLWEQKITESSTSSWMPLHNKPSKSGNNKYRGEIEIKLTFMCRSRNDAMSHGLKKRSSSIRNLASAFGDKLKLSRSRSFRELRDNHGEFESRKMGKSNIVNERGSSISPDGQKDALTRSYSMSAAYMKSMSLDRSKLVSYPSNSNSSSNVNNSANNNGSSTSFAHDATGTGVSQRHSQSLYNLPGNRRSCGEAPFHQPAPPPYDLKASSKDDSAFLSSRDRRAVPEPQISSAFRVPVASSHFEPVQRDRSGIYESITERTEPENSASSSDPESVPMPRPRLKRVGQVNVSSMENSSRDYMKENIGLALFGSRGNSADQHPFNGRDSGILDDRSPSLGNSLDGSIATTDGINNGFKIRGQVCATDCNMAYSKRDVPVNSAVDDKLKSHNSDKDMSMVGSTKPKKKVPVPSQLYIKDNGQVESVVRKRSRGQRDRLRQIRQANRRYTVQGLEHGASGLYDENVSDPSDSSRTEAFDDLMSVFKNMTKEELLQAVLTSKAQMIRKDQYIRDLENYIDDLLVRVMEATPRILSRQQLHKLR